jgi:hypothetical protein
VANLLNRRLVLAYNSGKGKEEVRLEMESLMKDFTIYGANDKYSKIVLTNLLEKLY